MNIIKLGEYKIKNIFSFIPIKKILKIIQKNKTLKSLFNLNINDYIVFSYFNNNINKYKFNSKNLQKIYINIVNNLLKNNNNFKENYIDNYINKYFYNHILENYPNLINKKICFYSYLNYSNYFINLNFTFKLKYFSLDDIDKNLNIIKNNKKIKFIEINSPLQYSLDNNEININNKNEILNKYKKNLEKILNINIYEGIKINNCKNKIFQPKIFEKINVNNLKNLTLSYLKLNDNNLKEILFYLNSNSILNLISLDLSINNFTDETCLELGNFISSKLKCLEIFNYQGNKISDEGCEILLKNLKFCNKIKLIDFCFSNITSKIFEILLDLSEYFKNLKQLNLFSNNFSLNFNLNNEQIKKLFNDYKQLEIFDFYEIKNTNEFIKYATEITNLNLIRLLKPKNEISNYLNKMKNLKEIYFIFSDELNEIFKNLSNNFLINLKKIYFVNDSIDEIVCDKMINMKNLIILSFSSCYLNLETFSFLIKNVFPNTKNLKDLTINKINLYKKNKNDFEDLNNFNFFNDEFYDDENEEEIENNFIEKKDNLNIFNEMFQNLSDLKKLNLSFNDIEICDLNVIIINLCKFCKNLKELNFQSISGMKKINSEFFWENLSKLKNIENIILSDNHLKNSFIKSLIKNIDNFPLLNILDLSKNYKINEWNLRTFLQNATIKLNHVERIYFSADRLINEVIIEFNNYLPGKIYFF